MEYPCRFQNASATTQKIIPHRVFAPACLKRVCQETLLPLIPPCLSAAHSVLGTHPFSRLDILIVPANFSSLGMARYVILLWCLENMLRNFFFFLLNFGPSGMQDLSSQTRDWTHTPRSGSTVLTAGPPGRFLEILWLFLAFSELSEQSFDRLEGPSHCCLEGQCVYTPPCMSLCMSWAQFRCLENNNSHCCCDWEHTVLPEWRMLDRG